MAGMFIAFRTHPNSGFVLRNVDSPMQEATLWQCGPEEYVAWLSGLDISSSRGPSFVFNRTCKRRTRRACCERTTMLQIGDTSIVSVVTTRPAVYGGNSRRRETYQRRMMRLTYAMTRNPIRWLSKVPVSRTGTPLARVAGPRLATTIRTPKVLRPPSRITRCLTQRRRKRGPLRARLVVRSIAKLGLTDAGRKCSGRERGSAVVKECFGHLSCVVRRKSAGQKCCGFRAGG